MKRALPSMWMMTDPRLGGGLLRAIQRLPQGSGVIFRHYDMDESPRRALFRQVAVICRRRGHRLLLSGNADMARKWHADGCHISSRHIGAGAPQYRNISKNLIVSFAVHDEIEMVQARRGNADMMLLSPLYVTNSHMGARPLGIMRFRHLAPLSGKAKLIALGGMTRQKSAMLDKRSVHGWAAIDAFKS